MKFGFFMMPLHHPSENPTLAFERDLDFIEYVDHLGFDECFIGEHHSAGWETIPAPDIFIAMAAAKTKRITLGTGVINLPYHHPFHVAERMAFLDHLTRGRLVMGVGPGVLATDLMLFGLSVDQVRPMSNESLEIIIKLLETDGPITYKGDYWQLNEMELMVKSYQKPRLPIAMASSGSVNSLTQAGRHGLPVWSLVNSPIAGSTPLSQQWGVVEAAAQEAGKTVNRDDWRLVHYVHVGETREQAMADVNDGILSSVSYNFGNGSQRQFQDYPEQPFGDVTAEQVVRNRGWIVGDPDQVTSPASRPLRRGRRRRRVPHYHQRMGLHGEDVPQHGTLRPLRHARPPGNQRQHPARLGQDPALERRRHHCRIPPGHAPHRRCPSDRLAPSTLPSPSMGEG